jgi:hypothetical protein
VKITPLPKFRPLLLTRENCGSSMGSEEGFPPNSPRQTQADEQPSSPRFPARINKRCPRGNCHSDDGVFPSGYQYTPSQELLEELARFSSRTTLPVDSPRVWRTTSASYSPTARIKEEEEPFQLQQTSENYSPSTRIKEELLQDSSASSDIDYGPPSLSSKAFDPDYYEDEEAYTDSIQR